jgi:PadR family transcriptional regulator, regulatory protein AphA
LQHKEGFDDYSMSLKHAILGFLSYKPLSGYDLKKAFDRSVEHFWPANQSQIYRELSDLHDKGWIRQKVIEREGQLDKKVYHITNSGREALHEWLAVPLPAADYREPFLIQIFFGGRLSDEELINLIKDRIQDLEETLTEYQTAYRNYQERLVTHDNPRAFFLSVIPLEQAILEGKRTITWLESFIKQIELKDYTLKDI